MKNKLFLCIAFFCLIAPLCSYPLRIDNPKMRVKLSADKSASGTITVDNPTTETVSVKVYLEDFTYVAPFDGTKDFTSRGTTKRSISNMITFSPEQFTLEPYASRQVNFIISPKNSFDETLGGVLFFETSIGTTVKEGQSIDVLGRLGALIFVDPQAGTKSLSVSEPIVSGESFTAMASNNGKVFVDAAGGFYIVDDNGTVYDRGSVNELFLMPGDKTAMKFNLSKALPSGRYTAVLTFDLQDGDVSTKEVDFSVSSSGSMSSLSIKD
jgi:hypothetical protein